MRIGVGIAALLECGFLCPEVNPGIFTEVVQQKPYHDLGLAIGNRQSAIALCNSLIMPTNCR